jgi:hypothetical protein
MDDGCHCDGHDGSIGSSIEISSSSSQGQHFECVDKSSGLTTVFEPGFETGPDGELRPILRKKVFSANQSK